MIQEIKMPSAGQTTDDAMIVAVNVQVGNTVERGDVLVEAETDKAVLPVESFAAGQVIDILVNVGQQVTAGDVLVLLGKAEDAANYRKSGASAEAPAPVKEREPEKIAAATASPVAVEEEYLPIIKGEVQTVTHASAANLRVGAPAMPNAKMLAREMGVDIAQVIPSNGEFIKRQDVLQYSVTPAAKAVREDAAQYEVLPMTQMRSIIGQRMLESQRTIPTWQCSVSIDMRACMSMREIYKEQYGVRVSYNDIMAKAVSIAARKFPMVNARVENDEVRIYAHTNIGLAVALDGALVVPVVQNVDCKGLKDIATEYKEKVAKAREGRLLPTDMGCGSITISNLGMYDVDSVTAIVNPPESCILAAGSIQVKPVWDGMEFQPVSMMTVSGSFDHRIIDGAYGAQFLQELRQLMENPVLMLH